MQGAGGRLARGGVWGGGGGLCRGKEEPVGRKDCTWEAG